MDQLTKTTEFVSATITGSVKISGIGRFSAKFMTPPNNLSKDIMFGNIPSKKE